MTKAEELKALEKIANIIESCGDDSYVGKAFEGCYLIAKENIENDSWISLKDRAEMNEIEANKWIDRATELELELEVTKKRVLSLEDLGTIKALIYQRQTEAQQSAKFCAEEIVNFADDPSSEDFQTAVRRHRAALREKEKCEELVKKVLEAMK